MSNRTNSVHNFYYHTGLKLDGNYGLADIRACAITDPTLGVMYIAYIITSAFYDDLNEDQAIGAFTAICIALYPLSIGVFCMGLMDALSSALNAFFEANIADNIEETADYPSMT